MSVKDLFNKGYSLKFLKDKSQDDTREDLESPRYVDSYSKLSHIANKPFVLALVPFNQPGSHFSVNIPMLAALYGVYNCESLSLLFNLDHPICIQVSEIKKRNG